MYTELLRKQGLFDDEKYVVDPYTKREKRETHVRSERDRKYLTSESHRPNMAISERVDEKMLTGRWQDTNVDYPDDDNKTALIAARSEALTKMERASVLSALSPPHNASVVIEKFGIPMTRQLLKCLNNGMWLNDEVTNHSSASSRSIIVAYYNPSRVELRRLSTSACLCFKRGMVNFASQTRLEFRRIILLLFL